MRFKWRLFSCLVLYKKAFLASGGGGLQHFAPRHVMAWGKSSHALKRQASFKENLMKSIFILNSKKIRNFSPKMNNSNNLVVGLLIPVIFFFWLHSVNAPPPGYIAIKNERNAGVIPNNIPPNKQILKQLGAQNGDSFYFWKANQWAPIQGGTYWHYFVLYELGEPKDRALYARLMKSARTG